MPEATIAEPPAVTPPPPPAAHPGAVTIDLANLGKKPAPIKDVKVETEKTPEPEKTTEAPKVADVVAAVTEPPKKPSDKEHNLAELRKAREAAEAARKTLEEENTKLKTEFEALKSKAPELPEDVKTKLTKAEEYEKQLQEARATIRQTDLARDPEFQAKYNKPIIERINIMGQTALAAGIPEADWKNAVTNWDRDQFAEWMESNMTPVQRLDFQTALMGATELYQAQQSELKNADTAYQELQKKRQTDAENQQKQYFSQNEQLVKSVLAETIKPETLKEYEDLGAAAEAIAMKAARHELPAKEIFQNLVHNQVLARVTVKQASEIENLKAQLAERDKKITEQDAFIADQAGAVPRGDAAGTNGAVDDNTPLWKKIVIKAPGS